jgi:preprotein translocase subunit SecG
MIPVITILILLACVILAFFILIQNPKGGGLSGSFGNASSQVMGVKQSTDVMEKGTWTMISVIGGLCIISVMFFQKPAGPTDNVNKAQQSSAPAKKSK